MADVEVSYETKYMEFMENVEKLAASMIEKMPRNEFLATSVVDVLVSKVKKQLKGQHLHESLEVEVREIIDEVVNIYKSEMIPQQLRKTIDQTAWHDINVITKRSVRVQVQSALSIGKFTDDQKATFDAELKDCLQEWDLIKKKKKQEWELIKQKKSEYYFQLCLENSKKWAKTEKRLVADEVAGRVIKIDGLGCQICHTKKTGIAIRCSSRSRAWFCQDCKAKGV